MHAKTMEGQQEQVRNSAARNFMGSLAEAHGTPWEDAVGGGEGVYFQPKHLTLLQLLDLQGQEDEAPGRGAGRREPWEVEEMRRNKEELRRILRNMRAAEIRRVAWQPDRREEEAEAEAQAPLAGKAVPAAPFPASASVSLVAFPAPPPPPPPRSFPFCHCPLWPVRLRGGRARRFCSMCPGPVPAGGSAAWA